jgi:hypothetical protein
VLRGFDPWFAPRVTVTGVLFAGSAIEVALTDFVGVMLTTPPVRTTFASATSPVLGGRRQHRVVRLGEDTVRDVDSLSCGEHRASPLDRSVGRSRLSTVIVKTLLWSIVPVFARSRRGT